MAEYNIPERIKESINRYSRDGVPTGDFLKAVLCNDLFGSLGRADDENRLALFNIGSYIYNEIPFTCWGSPEKYKAWIEKHAKQRQAVSDG